MATHLPLSRVFWISVANGPFHDLDGGEQCMKATSHDRLSCSTLSSDGDTSEVVIHSTQEKSLLDVVHTDNCCERIRARQTGELIRIESNLAFHCHNCTPFLNVTLKFIYFYYVKKILFWIKVSKE